MAVICFYAQFTASKAGLNGLSPVWDIEQITRSSGARSALVTGGANSITIGRRGLYGYVLSGADLTLYDYVATAITTDSSVDLKEVPALWTFWALSWHDILTSALTLASSIGKLFVDYLNATVGSRAVAGDAMTLTAAYNAAKTAAQAGDAMTLANDAITAAKFDESTAFPLKSSDTGATAVARTGADADTLETLSDQVDLVATASALSSVAANISTLLARIGAFTGTGVNTVLGFLKAMAQKAATLPSDIGGTFNPATDSLEVLGENVSAGTATIVSAVSGSEITVYRYATWNIDLTVGDITGYSGAGAKLWFTVKASVNDADTAAIIQIERGTGLTIINGAAAGTPANGSITVNDAGDGDITITLAVADAQNVAEQELVWDVKTLIGGIVTVKSRGTLNILAHETRSIT